MRIGFIFLLYASYSWASFDPAYPNPILMVRTELTAQDSMAILKQTIEEYGYQVAHVQRCDGGLAQFHYDSDFYRVVFFGRADELNHWVAIHPEIAPFLPLKIAVIAEKDESLLAALDPLALINLLPEDRELSIQLWRWHQDLTAILNEISIFKP